MQEMNSQINLGKGSTPLQKIVFNAHAIYLKREDLNPNGSFKDRSLSYQLSYHISRGKIRFVISSSGNAAISAAAYCSTIPNVHLDIFVSDHVNPVKLEAIKRFDNSRITIHLSAKPKSDAIKFARNTDSFNLRGSQDPIARVGYKAIASEIYRELPTVDAIYIPTSSGTSLLGIADRFKEIGASVAYHICQTTKINPIARDFDKAFNPENEHYSDAISDRVAHNKPEVLKVIKESKGFGWVISNSDLDMYRSWIEKFDIRNITNNSLLSLAGLFKSSEFDFRYQSPVAIISGT